MKAIVLAAGYATRLRPLTNSVAKPLLPVAGRPIVDYICDKISEVPQVDAIHVVTNERFAGGFTHWSSARHCKLPIFVHNDKTLSNEDRLGAIGDIRFTLEDANIKDADLLIIAGDNLFDFSLRDFVQFFQSKNGGSAIALYECPDSELVKQYSIVELDKDERLTSFIEKPKDPTTHLVGIATYIYSATHVPLLFAYLDEKNSPDQPGNFIAWLHKRAPVYGYRFAGHWLDIGNPEQLLEADNLMRKRRGLPHRANYSLQG